MKQYFQPAFLEKFSSRQMLLITLIQVSIIFVMMQFSSISSIHPIEVGTSFYSLVFDSQYKFADNMVSTLVFIIKGMGLATAISLFICYIGFLPFFRNVPLFVAKLRFLSYVGLQTILTYSMTAHDLKLFLLLYGIIPYFVTSFMGYIVDIHRKEYQLGYTLKMSNWKILWIVVIRGKLHWVMEVLIQNLGISWMLISSVEGLCYQEGGLGTLLNSFRRNSKPELGVAMLLIIFLFGMALDYFGRLLKIYCFPYTDTARYSNLWINKYFNKSKTAAK